MAFAVVDEAAGHYFQKHVSCVRRRRLLLFVPTSTRLRVPFTLLGSGCPSSVRVSHVVWQVLPLLLLLCPGFDTIPA